MEPSVQAHPNVPRGESCAGAGTTLAFRLERNDGPWIRLFVLAGTNLVWNGMTVLAVRQYVWVGPEIQWTFALFLAPFVLIGLVLLALLAAATLNSRSEPVLAAGRRCRRPAR